MRNEAGVWSGSNGLLVTVALFAAGAIQCVGESGGTTAIDTADIPLTASPSEAAGPATAIPRARGLGHEHGRGQHRPGRDHLYVGCRDATGTIQHYRISRETGAVTLVDTALANAAVSNTAIDADEKFLYVAHTDTGRITTFSRDGASGALTLKGFVTVPGSPDPTANPATQTLEIDHSGRLLLAANYTANTVLVYGIERNGMVGSLVASREDGLNAHQTRLNVDNHFALVPYLGSNFIAVYRFDKGSGRLTPHTPFTTSLPTPGAGPRHLAFHPNHAWVYVITETAGTISFFHFDNRRGTLSHVETVSSLPADFTGAVRSGSEIEIDSEGRFLYVSNRLDQVAPGILGVYAIDGHDGKLTPLQFVSSRGVTPRQFSLSPSGDLLVVGNQGSDNMSVFKVDGEAGLLDYVATTPVCSIPFFARMVAP